MAGHTDRHEKQACRMCSQERRELAGNMDRQKTQTDGTYICTNRKGYLEAGQQGELGQSYIVFRCSIVRCSIVRCSIFRGSVVQGSVSLGSVVRCLVVQGPVIQGSVVQCLVVPGSAGESRQIDSQCAQAARTRRQPRHTQAQRALMPICPVIWQPSTSRIYRIVVFAKLCFYFFRQTRRENYSCTLSQRHGRFPRNKGGSPLKGKLSSSPWK